MYVLTEGHTRPTWTHGRDQQTAGHTVWTLELVFSEIKSVSQTPSIVRQKEE